MSGSGLGLSCMPNIGHNVGVDVRKIIVYLSDSTYFLIWMQGIKNKEAA